MIPIYENYKDYRAPTYAHATIEELVSSLPKHCVSGLESVVLTNAAAVGKGKTGRIDAPTAFLRPQTILVPRAFHSLHSLAQCELYAKDHARGDSKTQRQEGFAVI